MANETDLIVQLRAETEKLSRDLNKAKGKMKRFQTQSAKITSAIQSQIAGAFAIGTLVSFGKAVIDTTAQFEKLKAVLTNTLGSKSEAEKSFEMLNKFASQTPFSVLELTESFVKLTNFGLKPSLEALRAYGDLASATGKSFDQLTEAIIDATTGEFERLKEFGIRAKKQGDKVTFTFKGVQTQVNFTSKSIREYIESLGDVQGVSGGMAAISETLSGKLSNLSDAFTNLKAAIGGVVATPITTFLENLTNIISGNSLETVEDFQAAINNLNKDIAKLEAQDKNGFKQQIALLKGLVSQYTQAISVMQNTFGPKQIPAINLDRPTAGTTKARSNQQTGPTSNGRGLTSILTDSFGQVPDIMKEINEVIADTFRETRNTFRAGFFEIQQVITKSGQDIQAVFLDIGDLITGGLNAIISGFDVGGLKGALNAFMGFLGDAMVQLGQALIAINTGKLALAKVPPPAGIAIGASLIAAGSLLSNSANKNLSGLSTSGGFGGGGFNGSVGGGQSVTLNGQFRIQGSDLVYVLDRERNITGRTG
jgi:hypothetical protein